MTHPKHAVLNIRYRQNGCKVSSVHTNTTPTEQVSTYLLVLVLFQVARRNQTLGIDVGVDLFWDQLRVWVQMLHFQEGEDVLHFHTIGAVSHCLALGGQAAGSHPAGILCLLPQETETHAHQSGGGTICHPQLNSREPLFPFQPRRLQHTQKTGRNPANV